MQAASGMLTQVLLVELLRAEGSRMSRRDTIEDMSRIAEERGGKCLSIVYTNQRTALRWRCAENHEWETAPANIKGSKNKSGTWCPQCGMANSGRQRMHTVEDMNRLAIGNDGAFVSNTYLGTVTKHLWRCNQYPSHPEFWKTPATVVQGQWCPVCSGNTKPTLDDLQALAQGRNAAGRLLSTTYENSATPLEWSCGQDGHSVFWKSYRNVKFDDGWCHECSREIGRPRKYDRGMLLELAKALNGELMSPDPYRSTKQQLTWRCVDGHTFTRTLGSIIAYRTFCPTCSRHLGFSREETIRQLFEYTFDAPFKRRKDLSWLINSHGNKMELDGYNEELLIAFEHNGLQHYVIDGFMTLHAAQLDRRTKDDREKARLCAVHDIRLVIIRHDISVEDLQDHLLHKLDELTINAPNSSRFTIGLISRSTLDEFRTEAQRRGGQLLSDRYMGSGETLEWKCAVSDHPSFKATPNSVINTGSWCRKCANERQSDYKKISIDTVRTWAVACGGELVAVGDIGSEAQSFGLSDYAEFRCSSCHRQRTRMIRLVRDGSLCLCHTNKVRIDRDLVAETLAKRGERLVEPVSITGGASKMTVECGRCGNRWPTRARDVKNGGGGCPKCRKNARISVERAREIGELAGFDLLDTEVDGGSQVLHWRCKLCSAPLEKPFRKMRNLRRCPNCSHLAATAGLVVLHRNGKTPGATAVNPVAR